MAVENIAKIKVIGVGGGGNNAVNRMILSGLKGASFAAVNTDKLILDGSNAEEKLVIGEKATRGLGAGAIPEKGAEAAEEQKEALKKMIEGNDMIFITAGMGGGTGTGAAPIVAQIAHEMGILTIAIVTKPFRFEGKRRMQNAIGGIEKLKSFVDTLLVIPNDKLVEEYPDLSSDEAYYMADEVLRNAVRGVTEIITRPAAINVDFADVETIVRGAGLAHMGIGEAEIGENGEDAGGALIEAVRRAVSCKLIETNIAGATGVIINYVIPLGITMGQIDQATNLIHEVVDEDANIIFGVAYEDKESKKIEVTLIATGFPESKQGNSTNPQSNQVNQNSIPKPDINTTASKINPTVNMHQTSIDPSAEGFAREIQVNPAFANLSDAGKACLDVIKKKVEIYRDSTIPQFVKLSIKQELESVGIDTSKL